MLSVIDGELSLRILDTLPNPVLVKDSNLRYIWVNKPFEKLFNIKVEDLIGKVDIDVFPNRQAAQCNGGDMRVLSSGLIDESTETIFKDGIHPRISLTRKSKLTLDNKDYLVGVMHDITDVTQANLLLQENKQQLEEQSSKLSVMAYSDPLTGVLNRRRLYELAEVIFGTHRNFGSILLCDLDYFKLINDKWGHETGDVALIHFVNIVKDTLRESDLISRIGGEEFVLLLPGTNLDESVLIAERIRTKLENSPLIYEENKIYMTVSIGISLQKDKKFNLEALINSADKALYKAKNTGRNTTVLS